MEAPATNVSKETAQKQNSCRRGCYCSLVRLDVQTIEGVILDAIDAEVDVVVETKKIYLSKDKAEEWGGADVKAIGDRSSLRFW
eukprot:gene7547-9826_t